MQRNLPLALATVFAIFAALLPRGDAADEVDLVTQAGWSKFLSQIRDANVEDLRQAEVALENAGDDKAPADRRAFMLERIAARYSLLDESDAAMQVLESIIDMPLPADLETATRFSSNWRSAAFDWAEQMFLAEKSDELLSKLRSFAPSRGCFAQQLVQTVVLNEWTGNLFGPEAAAELQEREFARLVDALPERPHYLALSRYASWVEHAAAIDKSQRVRELNRVRRKARQAIEETRDSHDAIEYLKALGNGNRAVAFLSLRDADNAATIGQLSEELGSYAEMVAERIPADDARRDWAVEFLRSQRDGFESDIARKVGRMGQLDGPRIFDSELIGKRCPELAGEVILDPGVWDESEQAGAVLLLDFWSTSCGPCIKAFPKLVELHERYHDAGLRIVGIAPLPRQRWSEKEARGIYDVKASREQRVRAMQEFVKEHGLPFRQVADTDGGSIAEVFGVFCTPTYVVVGRDGIVKLIAGGGADTFAVMIQRIENELLGTATSKDAERQ